MRRDVLIERFFTALIAGNRPAARAIVDELLQADCAADQILIKLFWPTLEHIQSLYKHDQLSDLAHHYATRLLRSLADQMQIRLEQKDRRNKKVMVVCGPEESEEIGAQITCDLLEADGYEVLFVGGAVANDEIVAQLGETQTDALVIFGVIPSTVPFTRLLIDRLHEIGVCPKLQIAVGGGVFNRADGLAEEIGADLWATDPEELVQSLGENPTQRMGQDQRTVGRKRRTMKQTEAA
ncbi:MAG: cobalamin-dependent protein [Phycisphaeraceae bacterium]|nr:cobalamin-dependent protein [Phycisphaeraceae bacterium]